MKIIARAGKEELALVYVAEIGSGEFVEFVESVQPPKPREEKWVLIISTSIGCRVGCRFCDAGGYFQRPLSQKEMISQLDYLVRSRFPDKKVGVKKFKIQFARMGEPSFNFDVLEVLYQLRELYDAPGLLPCISTIAPAGSERFFRRLLSIKREIYPQDFQLQFSIHTTDDGLRDRLIPFKKWSLAEIARYGDEFYEKNARKITLNFALGDRFSLDQEILLEHFDPSRFLIKITPINPTFRACKNRLSSSFEELKKSVNRLQDCGYETLLSIGELEENLIGSNCGQYVTRYKGRVPLNAYTYELERL